MARHKARFLAWAAPQARPGPIKYARPGGGLVPSSIPSYFRCNPDYFHPTSRVPSPHHTRLTRTHVVVATSPPPRPPRHRPPPPCSHHRRCPPPPRHPHQRPPTPPPPWSKPPARPHNKRRPRAPSFLLCDPVASSSLLRGAAAALCGMDAASNRPSAPAC